MSPDTVLLIVTVGSFIAAFVNAAFATGGIYILLATTTAVFPVTVAVPLQSVLAFASLAARVLLFRHHIKWSIVKHFAVGSVFGVLIGAKVFVSLSEALIATMLGGLLLFLMWIPTLTLRIPIKYPFTWVGVVHSFLGMLFGVGAILQPIIFRTQLKKLEITSTLAGCLIIMDIFKIIGYVSHGFNYLDYLPHIILATIAGFIGTYFGQQVTHMISETAFRTIFRWLVTVLALRLLFKGLSSF